MCPFDQYIDGIRVLQDPDGGLFIDDTGLNAISFRCSHPLGRQDATWYTTSAPSGHIDYSNIHYSSAFYSDDLYIDFMYLKDGYHSTDDLAFHSLQARYMTKIACTNTLN